jgi:hypothetical protein
MVFCHEKYYTVMLDWFRAKPKCPVDESTKSWIETRFSWLTDKLGIERLQTGRTVLTTEEFLPLTYERTEEGIHDLMCRVATLMDVDSATLNLGFYEDGTPQFEGVINSRSAGLYTKTGEKFDIWLEVYSLDDPVSVIGTLAHEIGHVILLGQNRISPDEPDHEELTDLLTVFLGLGIFPANSVVYESNWTEGQWSGWSMGKRGYMSMDMYGYAMSLYTLARDDPSPEWAVHLRPDVRAALKRGVRYIESTQDCSFKPATNCGRSKP